MKKRIVLKIGSQSIIDRNGFVQSMVLSEIIDEVIKLKNDNHSVIIVASGAVALGRSIMKKLPNFLNNDLEKKVAASLGQPILLGAYQNIAQKAGYWCPQILLTKDDFSTRQRYVSMMNLFEGLLTQENLIPIVNENDTVIKEDSMFVDNDELAGLLAAMVRSDKLIIMTVVDGVFDKNPTDRTAQLIQEIEPDSIAPIIGNEKSTIGRGGMRSKLQSALKVSKLGIETIIMNVEKRHMLTQYDDPHIGTHIKSHKTVSSLKKWLSFSKGVAGVYLNPKASALFQEPGKVLSLLPLGVVAIHGDFRKNDVVYVLNESHEIIAIGLTAYDSETLKEYMGKKEQPELIHYNHLYIY